MAPPRIAPGSWGKIRYIQNENETWTARGTYRDVMGKSHDYAATARTKNLATSNLKAKADSERRSGNFAADMTLSELWAARLAWMRSDENRYSKGSLADYDNVFQRHIAPGLGELRLHEFRVSHIDQFLLELRKSFTATTAQARVVLHHCFEEAVRNEVLDRNPVDAVARSNRGKPLKVGQIEKAPPRALTQTEARRVLALCRVAKENPGHAGGRAIPILEIFTCLFAGMRIGEALALRWEDVIPATGERIAALFVCGTIVHRDGKTGPPVRQTHTKTKQNRVVLVPSEIIALLDAFRPDGVTEGLIFRTADGGPLSPHNVRRKWRSMRDVAGLPPNVVPHDARRTVATHIKGTMGIAAARDVLGHVSTAMTEGYVDATLVNTNASDVIRTFFE